MKRKHLIILLIATALFCGSLAMLGFEYGYQHGKANFKNTPHKTK